MRKPPRNYREDLRKQEIAQKQKARSLRAGNRPPGPSTAPEDSRPKVLVVADVDTWAWAKKAKQLVRHLSDEFAVDTWYSAKTPPPARIAEYDVVHTFEFPQVDKVPEAVPSSRVVTGLTAHVWQTWGAAKVRAWCQRAAAVHANSVLLVEELAHVLPGRIYYTPNGVCTDTFRRILLREGPLVVGHVGKPNPRKGHELIREACDAAGVELQTVARRHGNALSEEAMVDWYQDIDVILVASDMDGTPNPALEGAACECAIVTNAIGNMPELVEDGVSGYVVERSVEGLVKPLKMLKERPELARLMGYRAREAVLAGWTWRRQSSYYRRLWRDVVAGNTESVSSVAYGERKETTS